MKIFRGGNGRLYNIYLVSPMKILGSWYEAVPMFGGKTKKHIKLSDYEVVSER